MVRPRLGPGQGGIALREQFLRRFRRQAVENRSLRLGQPLAFHHSCVVSARYNIGVPLVIRDFKAEDFEPLWRMDQECFPPGIAYSRQELKSYLRQKGSFALVANDVNDGKIAGFIVATGGLSGHIITIDVLPTARRAGVGSTLLRAAEARLLSSGSLAVGLETAVDNISALSFYKRHGYHVIRTWPRYYSNGVDALVLKKDLKQPPH